MPGVGDHPPAAGVAGHRPRHHLLGVERALGGRQQAEQVAAARDGLEAAAVAAAADRPGLVDRDVPDLARRPVRTAVEPAVEHETRADAGGHLDVDRVPPAAGRAPGDLAERADVRVVLDQDGHLPRLLEAGPQVGPGPPGQDLALHAVGALVERAGDGHPDAEDALAVLAGRARRAARRRAPATPRPRRRPRRRRPGRPPARPAPGAPGRTPRPARACGRRRCRRRGRSRGPGPPPGRGGPRRRRAPRPGRSRSARARSSRRWRPTTRSCGRRRPG